jgi:hypothetical protein
MYAVSKGTETLNDYLKDTEDNFETTSHTPEELIQILIDLQKKADKLNSKIEFLSANLKIPVNKELNPGVSNEVAKIDPTSGGEYITYQMYNELLKEQEYVKSKLSVKDLVENSTGDEFSDSVMVQNLISQSYANYSGATVAKDNEAERYTNRWLNNLLSWNEHEYGSRQILNFADNYLDINPDPAYIPWSVRRDVGEESADVKNLQELWSHFSDSYKGKVGDFVGGVKELAALRPDKRIADLTTRSIVYANDFLDKLNEIFDMSWAVNLVCCFMQFGIKLDIKTLKAFRALLQLLASGITLDCQDILNGLKDILNNIFRGLLMNNLVGLITEIYQRLADPVKRWLNSPKEDVWNKIFACTPVAQLIEKYMVDATDYLYEMLTKLIQNWYKKMELKRIKQGLICEKKSEQKWIGELAKLLDAIIGVTEAAAKCGIRGAPVDEASQQITNNYNIGNVNEEYVFAVEENPTIYNSFIPKKPAQKDQQSASTPKTTNFDTAPVGGKSSVPGNMKLSDCLKNMPSNDFEGIRDWS